MVYTDQIVVMLQTLEMSKKGGAKNIADPKINRIATFTLPVESPGKVNEMMEKGLKAGGIEPTEPIDEGFMQIRNLEDLDGHMWGIIFLDIEKFKKMTGK
jgi:predicted lactoylglutathione lyase